MLTARDTLDLCDGFPELEIRLQSFRRAGTSLSRKGAKKMDAMRLRTEIFGPHRRRVLAARAGAEGHLSGKMACSAAILGDGDNDRPLPVTVASDEVSVGSGGGTVDSSGGGGGVRKSAAQQLLGLCDGDAIAAMEALLQVAKTVSS